MRRIAGLSIIIISILTGMVPSVFGAEEELQTENFFTLTQARYEELDDYYLELLGLLDEYRYDTESLPVEKLITIVVQHLLNKINETRHNLWTLNRLLCAESFHERLQQYSPRAFEVITLYFETSLEIVEADLASLADFPRHVPSMNEVPLLQKHYERTVAHLEQAKQVLQQVHARMNTRSDQAGSLAGNDQLRADQTVKGE